jgi:hypothetical protein
MVTFGPEDDNQVASHGDIPELKGEDCSNQSTTSQRWRTNRGSK